MRILTIILLLSSFHCFISAQGFFLEKHELNSNAKAGWTIDNYEDNQYLISGLKVNLDSILYLFVGVLNDSGQILKYDSIPQIEYIISINKNNDFTTADNGAIYYDSAGTGRHLIYSYDVGNNELIVEDTLVTYLDDFSGKDFIEIGDNDYIICGLRRYDPGFNIGLYKVQDGLVSTFSLPNGDLGGSGIRIFENDDDTFEVLCLYSSTRTNATIGVLTFDQELNLLDSLIADTTMVRTEFTDAIRDAEGNYVYGCYTLAPFNSPEISYAIPMISQMSADGSSTWDTPVGRTYNNDGIISGWFGLTESVEGDGYVAAGTMAIIGPPAKDTAKTFGALVKLDKQGEEVWYREYSSIDTSRAFTNFRDVVTTSDGYMVIGDDHCWSGYSGCDRLYNLLIMRTDAEGRIMPDSSSTVVTIQEDYEMALRAYPNPTVEYLYIEHELGQSATYDILDMQGRVLTTMKAEEGYKTVRVDASSWPSGTYFIRMTDKSGKSNSLTFVKK